MPNKVRVFISSTMEDLANERQAVADAVRGLNLEPVNAEGLLPNGASSWDLLADEIEISHIFILILGDRYGWVPTSGYGAGLGKSVTHLEFDVARRAGIPILPFVKRLRYGTPTRSKEAKARNRFRAEVADWQKGMFRAEFDLARDLGVKVREALLDVFQDSYLKRSVRRVAADRAESTEDRSTGVASSGTDPAPNGAMLFAGAGFSLGAGYPSAAALADVLAQRMGLQVQGAEILSRHSFTDLVALAETRLGRSGLVRAMRELLDTPLPVAPTSAHLAAVQLFPVIVTTNYDLLFERACQQLELNYGVFSPTQDVIVSPGSVTIYKIHGSIDREDTLALTEADYQCAPAAPQFWNLVKAALQTRPVAVVGHSIRDETSQQLLSGRNLALPGVYVSPKIDDVDGILLHRYQLDAVMADADTFMSGIASGSPLHWLGREIESEG